MTRYSDIRWRTLAYVLALLFLGGLTGGTWWLTDGIMARQTHVEEVINMAGRQRMLSQRLAKLALLWDSSSPAQQRILGQQISESIEMMQAGHDTLAAGRLRTPELYTPEIAELYERPPHAINQMVADYLDDMRRLVSGVQPSPQLLPRILSTADHLLLDKLDRVVMLYQLNAQAANRDLVNFQRIAIAIIMMTLLLEGWLVFRPLFRSVLRREKRYQLLLERMSQGMLRRSEQLLLSSSALAQTGEGVLILDHSGNVLSANPAACHLLGEEEGQLLQHPAPFTRLPSEMAGQQQVRIWHCLQTYGVWEGELAINHSSGRPIAVWWHINRITQQQITGYVALCHAMSASQTEALRHLAFHDALTGLPNRYLMMEQLAAQMQTGDSACSPFSLICLDIDRFKNINDSMGHEAGDILLGVFSRRLRASLPSRCMLARMGADEFAIIQPGEQTPQSLDALLQQIYQVGLLPIELNGLSLQISLSIGVARYPGDGSTASELMRSADSALFQAKGEGGNMHRLFDAGLGAHVSRNTRLEIDLRQAIEQEQLILHYQPKVRLDTGSIVGVEALVRWPHPQEGMLAPDLFIPLAETTGLIVPLGDLVLRLACAQIREWCQQGWNISIAVNVSVRQLLRTQLHERIPELLQIYGIPAHLLQIEITESTAMQNMALISEQLIRLQQLGIRIAIDDFGTGHSSLAMLKNLPVDLLKVDKSFVIKATDNSEDARLVETIIGLAHLMHKEVIAEGVETAEHAALLQRLGCEQGQGYYFSRPVSSEVLTHTHLVSSGISLLPVKPTSGQHVTR